MSKLAKKLGKNDFLNKLDKLKDNKLDLSSDEDLSIALMNLISIEEHFFFTAEKTGKSHYFDLLREIREMRKELLKKIIKDYEGEVWCISKHLLASSMRLMEVGTKQLGKDDKKAAEAMFDKAYNLYSMFWGLNLGQIKLDGVKKIDNDVLDKKEQAQKDAGQTKKSSIFGKTRDLVKRLVDCCIE